MPSLYYSDESVSIVSECTIVPDSKPLFTSLRLTSSDLPRLTCPCIQMGCLFSGHPNDHTDTDNDSKFISHLKLSFSKALSAFPPLSGRLSTDPSTSHISITCFDAGALFVHARAPSLHLSHILDPSDVPTTMLAQFFPLNDTIAYDGHSIPLVAVQVTLLADAVFIGCSGNHGVIDGTSFWNFFNTFSEISRGATKISRPPSFSRRPDDCVLYTDAVPSGGLPPCTRSDGPLRERIFHFSREAVLAIKKRANGSLRQLTEISSYQSVCALLWRSITRARKLPPNKTTTIVMPVCCRTRANPKMDPLYFGNSIQSFKTVALAGEVVTRELGWSGDLLRRGVREYNDRAVREWVEEWERDPRYFPVQDLDGATIMIGNSPRFGMYDNDFGWGRPVAVRSGKSCKFDGKFSSGPGWEGDGSMEVEVVLVPETMAELEKDDEFMQYVS